QPLDHLHGGRGVMLVGNGQGLLERLGSQPVERKQTTGKTLRLLQRAPLSALPGSQAQLSTLLAQQYAMAPGEGKRQPPERGLVYREPRPRDGVVWLLWMLHGLTQAAATAASRAA